MAWPVRLSRHFFSPDRRNCRLSCSRPALACRFRLSDLDEGICGWSNTICGCVGKYLRNYRQLSDWPLLGILPGEDALRGCPAGKSAELFRAFRKLDIDFWLFRPRRPKLDRIYIRSDAPETTRFRA